MKITPRTIAAIAIFTLSLAASSAAQSRHSAKGVDLEGTILSVTAVRNDKKTDPIKVENLYLYENGIEQKIKNFSFDPSPAKIVLLVDNSQTLPTSIELMKKAAMEFAYEIFEGDQLFTIAYDEKPEIIQEWWVMPALFFLRMQAPRLRLRLWPRIRPKEKIICLLKNSARSFWISRGS